MHTRTTTKIGSRLLARYKNSFLESAGLDGPGRRGKQQKGPRAWTTSIVITRSHLARRGRGQRPSQSLGRTLFADAASPRIGAAAPHPVRDAPDAHARAVWRSPGQRAAPPLPGRRFRSASVAKIAAAKGRERNSCQRRELKRKRPECNGTCNE